MYVYNLSRNIKEFIRCTPCAGIPQEHGRWQTCSAASPSSPAAALRRSGAFAGTQLAAPGTGAWLEAEPGPAELPGHQAWPPSLATKPLCCLATSPLGQPEGRQLQEPLPGPRGDLTPGSRCSPARRAAKGCSQVPTSLCRGRETQGHTSHCWAHYFQIFSCYERSHSKMSSLGLKIPAVFVFSSLSPVLMPNC